MNIKSVSLKNFLELATVLSLAGGFAFTILNYLKDRNEYAITKSQAALANELTQLQINSLKNQTTNGTNLNPA